MRIEYKASNNEIITMGAGMTGYWNNGTPHHLLRDPGVPGSILDEGRFVSIVHFQHFNIRLSTGCAWVRGPGWVDSGIWDP